MDIPHILYEFVHRNIKIFCADKHGLQDSATSLDRGMTCQGGGQLEETYLHIPSGDEIIQISTAELIHKLPDHIMAGVILWEEGKSFPLAEDMGFTLMEYLSQLVSLLVSLCPTVHRMDVSLELFNADFQMRLIDSITLFMLAISSEAGRMRMMRAISEGTDPVLLRDVAAIVHKAHSCIEVVGYFMTEKETAMRNLELASEDKVRHSAVEIETDCVLRSLKLHPRGWVFLESAIEYTRVIMHMLVLCLRQESKTISWDLFEIATNLDYMMAILESFFANEGIYSLYIQFDANAASLGRLICTSMDLVTNSLSIPPFVCICNSNTYSYEPRQRMPGPYFYPTDYCKGQAEFIVARACAMIVSLESHKPSFYTSLCEKDEESKTITRVMSEGITGILKQILRRPTIDSYTASLGESQLAINCLRAANVLGMSANFKPFKSLLQGEIAILLSTMAPGDFRSFWGPGCLAIRYMNVDLRYVNSSNGDINNQQEKYCALIDKDDRKMLRDVMTGLPEPLEGQYSDVIERGLKLALERSVLLIKLIASILTDIDLKESRFFKHLTMFVENGAHDYLVKNLHYICTLAHKCKDGDVINEAEMRLLDTVSEAIIYNV